MSIGDGRPPEQEAATLNIINDCMLWFIGLMESKGYKVWSSSSWQCRDRLLFGDKYLKEKMEYADQRRNYL